MAQNDVNEKTKVDAQKFAEMFSNLPDEEKKMVFYTVNGMLMSQKAQELNTASKGA